MKLEVRRTSKLDLQGKPCYEYNIYVNDEPLKVCLQEDDAEKLLDALKVLTKGNDTIVFSAQVPQLSV